MKTKICSCQPVVQFLRKHEDDCIENKDTDMEPLVRMCSARHLAKALNIDISTALQMIDDVVEKGSESLFSPVVHEKLLSILTPIVVEMSKFHEGMTPEEDDEWGRGVADALGDFFAIMWDEQ